MSRTPQNNGPCVVCGKDVIHTYPWWTDGKPIHEECWGKWNIGKSEECIECTAIGKEKCSEHCGQNGKSIVQASPACKALTTNQTECRCDECKLFTSRKVEGPETYTKEQIDERIDGILSYLGLPNLGHMGHHLTLQQLEKALNDLRRRFL